MLGLRAVLLALVCGLITACSSATVAPPLDKLGVIKPAAFALPDCRPEPVEGLLATVLRQAQDDNRCGLRAASVAYATFEWNVDDAVSRWRAGSLWRFLAAKHVDDVLAGFDDAQIAKYSTKPGAAEFNAMIAQGRSHGVKFELLLGDPSWIPPSGIPKLEAIWKQLRALDFAGVNLDLEPNEVSGTPLRTVLDDLVASMHAYVTASPWQPVTLDLNYYYADGTLTPKGYCLLCKLRAAGVRSIDLMTYIQGPDTVATDVTPLLTSYPAIEFAIAQSVEPPSVLPPSDSYWGLGFAKFYADMTRLDARLKPLKNYNGIAIESLYYIEKMP